MRDLVTEINRQVREDFKGSAYRSNPSIQRLVNEVIADDVDIEQVITFLDDAISREHRNLAINLREAFVSTLQDSLDKLQTDIPNVSFLYAALVDMHDVAGIDEDLAGFLTLNYDSLLEHAIKETLGREVNYGIAPWTSVDARAVQVLKLHGSLDWNDSWPIASATEPLYPLWIPPGIQKAKSRYPFSVIWGKARELLDCDVLRIIGCRLSPNDWDLVSLLFSTQQTHSSRPPYVVEFIDFPRRAYEVKEVFPYLSILSVLEIDELGEQIISEVTRTPPRRFSALSEVERDRVIELCESDLGNPFSTWLRLRAEVASRDLDSIATEAGVFNKILESDA